METPGPDPQLVKEQRQKAEKLRLAKIERHIFLCCDPTKAKCCSRKRAWVPQSISGLLGRHGRALLFYRQRERYCGRRRAADDSGQWRLQSCSMRKEKFAGRSVCCIGRWTTPGLDTLGELALDSGLHG